MERLHHSHLLSLVTHPTLKHTGVFFHFSTRGSGRLVVVEEKEEEEVEEEEEGMWVKEERVLDC